METPQNLSFFVAKTTLLSAVESAMFITWRHRNYLSKDFSNVRIALTLLLHA